MPITKTTITGPLLDTSGEVYKNVVLRLTPARAFGDDGSGATLAQTTVDVVPDENTGDFSVDLAPSIEVTYRASIVIRLAHEARVYDIGTFLVPESGPVSLQSLLDAYSPPIPSPAPTMADLQSAINQAESAATAAVAARDDAQEIAYGPDPVFGTVKVTNKLTLDSGLEGPGFVGTVSQSGGTPTGAIIERGSNPNGEFVKYADGTQICWSVSQQIDLTSSAGTTSTVSAFTPPASFVGTPSIYGTLNAEVAGWEIQADRGRVLLVARFRAGNVELLAYAISPLDGTFGAANILSIGRWF